MVTRASGYPSPGSSACRGAGGQARPCVAYPIVGDFPHLPTIEVVPVASRGDTPSTLKAHRPGPRKFGEWRSQPTRKGSDMNTLLDGSPMPPSYIQRKHAAMPQVPGEGGQNMAVTWKGPGRTRRPNTIVRPARPTGGRVEGAESEPTYRLTRSERRAAARQTRQNLQRRGRD